MHFWNEILCTVHVHVAQCCRIIVGARQVWTNCECVQMRRLRCLRAKYRPIATDWHSLWPSTSSRGICPMGVVAFSAGQSERSTRTSSYSTPAWTFETKKMLYTTKFVVNLRQNKSHALGTTSHIEVVKLDGHVWYWIHDTSQLKLYNAWNMVKQLGSTKFDWREFWNKQKFDAYSVGHTCTRGWQWAHHQCVIIVHYQQTDFTPAMSGPRGWW
jgi:hypothetical protein